MQQVIGKFQSDFKVTTQPGLSVRDCMFFHHMCYLPTSVMYNPNLPIAKIKFLITVVSTKLSFVYLFVYLGFNVTFNTLCRSYHDR